MTHAYSDLPSTSYWRKSVSGRAPTDIDPMIGGTLAITPSMRVATAGSCFSQRISRHLQKSAYNFFRTEAAPAEDADNPFYDLFSAAYGNVYTTAQLHQLMKRAYGLIEPKIGVWRNDAGRYLDPFRPGLNEHGFADEVEMLALQERHLACVRRMFEETQVFVFTLGLTEAWADEDGIVVPIIPGVIGAAAYEPHYRFVNFSVAKIISDLTGFVRDLKSLNRQVNVILTVSPVPMIATYERRHVVVSNMYSKSALRAAAGEVVAAHDFVHYFPSFEIIVGHQSRAQFYDDDLRDVHADGVAHVMATFGRHFLSQADDPAPPVAVVEPAPPLERILREYEEVAGVVCDEERLV